MSRTHSISLSLLTTLGLETTAKYEHLANLIKTKDPDEVIKTLTCIMKDLIHNKELKAGYLSRNIIQKLTGENILTISEENCWLHWFE